MPIYQQVPTGALVGAEKLFGRGWCPAFGCHFGFSNQQTIGVPGAFEETTRQAYRNLTGKAIDGLMFVFANCGNSGTGEGNTGNAITVKASVQKKGSTVTDESNKRYDVTFGGNIEGFIPDRGIIESDPLSFRVEIDEVIYVYGTQTATSGALAFPIGGSIFGDVQDFGLNNGEGRLSNGDYTRDGSGALAGNNGGGNRVFRPAAILGHCVDNVAVSSVCQFSDSKGAGANDLALGRNDYAGYFARLCKFDQSTGGVPFSNLSCTGHSAAGCAATDGMATRLKIAKYFTHAIVAYEYNDRGGNLTTLKSNLQKIVKNLRWEGIKVMVGTSYPGSIATTDGYQTVGNQTQETNTNRTGLNTHLDDLTSTGFIALSDKVFTDLGLVAANYGWCKVIDLAAGIEVNVSNVATRNGGYVLAPTTNTAFTTSAALGSSSLCQINALGATWNQYAGWLFYWSGGGANKFDIIRDNGTASIAPNDGGGNPKVQLENGLSNNITNTQTVQIYNGMIQRDTIHPATPGHIAIAAGCQTTFNAYMAL